MQGSTASVGRGRATWILINNSNRSNDVVLTCGFQVADPEGVSNIARIANTVGVVVSHRARGISATHSWTGVLALLRDAGKMCWTLLVDGAFRFALNIRVSLKTRQTLTRGRPGSLIAFGIDATWRGVAGINYLRNGRSCC